MIMAGSRVVEIRPKAEAKNTGKGESRTWN
jgi:hypothetical protein